MVTDLEVRRVDFGYFVRPAEETEDGHPRVEPCFGYAVQHGDGLLIIDTGMGSHPDVDAHYRPQRIPLAEALASIGTSPADVRFVVNCHLHFDHCGGNPELTTRPIYTQRTELEAAKGADYTLPELVDGPGLEYEVLDGESEILPGVLVIPTPGHTDGHQSVVLRRHDGTVVVAGQCHDSATEFGRDVLATRARRGRHISGVAAAPGWLERLMDLDPRRVVFAHDGAVWEP